MHVCKLNFLCEFLDAAQVTSQQSDVWCVSRGKPFLPRVYLHAFTTFEWRSVLSRPLPCRRCRDVSVGRTSQAETFGACHVSRLLTASFWEVQTAEERLRVRCSRTGSGNEPWRMKIYWNLKERRYYPQITRKPLLGATKWQCRRHAA